MNLYSCFLPLPISTTTKSAAAIPNGQGITGLSMQKQDRIRTYVQLPRFHRFLDVCTSTEPTPDPLDANMFMCHVVVVFFLSFLFFGGGSSPAHKRPQREFNNPVCFPLQSSAQRAAQWRGNQAIYPDFLGYSLGRGLLDPSGHFLWPSPAGRSFSKNPSHPLPPPPPHTSKKQDI